MGENSPPPEDIVIPTLCVTNHLKCILQSAWVVSERPFGVITNASVYLVSHRNKTKRVPIAPSRFTLTHKGKMSAYDMKSNRIHLIINNATVSVMRGTTLETIRATNAIVKYTYFVSKLNGTCTIHTNESTIDLKGSIFDNLIIHAHGGKVINFRVVSTLTVHFNTPTQIAGKVTSTTVVYKHGEGDLKIQDFILRR